MVTTDQSRELLTEYVADRRHWKIYERGEEVYAGRMFTYPTGKEALLSLRNVGSSDGRYRNFWAAQVNIAFSAGPEDQTEGKLAGCLDWLKLTERRLDLPSSLQGLTTGQSVRDAVELWDNRTLRLLSAVLEFDTYDRQAIFTKLVAMFGPSGARKAVSGRG